MVEARLPGLQTVPDSPAHASSLPCTFPAIVIASDPRCDRRGSFPRPLLQQADSQVRGHNSDPFLVVAGVQHHGDHVPDPIGRLDRARSSKTNTSALNTGSSTCSSVVDV